MLTAFLTFLVAVVVVVVVVVTEETPWSPYASFRQDLVNFVVTFGSHFAYLRIILKSLLVDGPRFNYPQAEICPKSREVTFFEPNGHISNRASRRELHEVEDADEKSTPR